MINLFEKMDTASRDFLRSQIYAGLHIPSVAIDDDGFLPIEVDSPIKFFCKFSDQNTPLYFNRLKVGKFQRITASARGGEVYDLHKKRAEIIFAAQDNSRLVKEVRWLDEEGNVSWIDHYNYEGRIFAKTLINNGQEAVRKYFDNAGKVVIEMFLQSGDIFLNYQNQEHYFPDLAKFVQYYLKAKKYNLDHILYNTLNQSLMVSLGIGEGGSDTLFWHEKLNDELPANMTFLMENKTRTKHIIFQDHTDWITWKDKLPQTDNVDFGYLGYIYPHPRGNKMRHEAIILTNSDQIEHLTDIVELLPGVHFHIVALTQMSDKLLKFNKYNNVNLYPNATFNKIQELYKLADIYLDINHENEILDAVRGAFEQNMLILAFENTVHNRKFINPENIFKKEQVKELALQITQALDSVDKMRELIDCQRVVAGDAAAEDYKRVIEELK